MGVEMQGRARRLSCGGTGERGTVEVGRATPQPQPGSLGGVTPATGSANCRGEYR